MAGSLHSPLPHNPESRRPGAHTWLVCTACGMGYAPLAYARSAGVLLRPGDPDPDLSWHPTLDAPCGGPLRCACHDP